MGVARGVGRRLVGVVSPSRVVHVDAGYAIPPWNELVLYEVNLRSLVGVRGMTTWARTLARLDYLRDLGINAIELVGYGEWSVDEPWAGRLPYLFAVNEGLGGRDGLRTLVNEAHRRGIAVFLNVDYSHLEGTGGDLWRFDGYAADARSGGIYVYEDGRCRTPWGGARFDFGASRCATIFGTTPWGGSTTALRMGSDGVRFAGSGTSRAATTIPPTISPTDGV